MDEIDALLSDEGWPHASALPVEPGDPGRFHALFGRDSLITALQLLPVRPDVADATLRALAARQGTREHPGTLEEPGKIGHEFRDRPPDTFVELGWPDDGPFAYYGTADATSWFLVLAARCPGVVTDASVRAATEWLAHALDRGDGLVRHAPGTWPALTQQGWRDGFDPTTGHGIIRPDGRVPEPPLADTDSQAVAYAALRASGEHERADALRARLSADFVPDVMALEAGDVPVRGAGSQLGWLLWADALEPDARDAVADRLCAPDILTTHGLRTLSSDSPVFDAQSYHRGSVWPFDSWLGWGGLRAAGRTREAEQVRRGVLAALEQLGRAPELYAVTDDGAVAPIPLSNRIQAWTVGARWALAGEWDAR